MFFSNHGNNCSCLWILIIVILLCCCCGGSWGDNDCRRCRDCDDNCC